MNQLPLFPEHPAARFFPQGFCTTPACAEDLRHVDDCEVMVERRGYLARVYGQRRRASR